MKRLAVLMALAIAVTIGVVPMMGPTGTHASTPSKKVCKSKTVVKKVHGHKKRVKVTTCHTVKPKPTSTPRPTPTQDLTLAEVSGSQDVNAIMNLGILLGPSYFCCFEQSQGTFLAPAHFQVAWSVTCANAGDGTHYLAMFYLVGYDGKYQPEGLYTGYDAGSQTGVTNVDSTAEKRWAFVISDSAAQGCTYHLTAKKL